MSELRFAVRRLRRSPGFTLAAALTVGLALGVNGIVLGAVRGLLVHPLPFHDADRLVWIYGTRGPAGAPREPITGIEATQLARQAGSYEGVAVVGDRAFVRPEGDRRTRWHGIWVTPSLFGVLGVRPAIGRPLTADDARPGARVMMLGYERWRRDFGGSDSVLGRPVRFVDGHVYTVVGVLPRGLEFPFARAPQFGNGSGFVVGAQDFWIVGQEGDELPGGAALARLRPDATVERAGAEAATVSRRLAAADPGGHADRSLEIVPMRDQALGLVRPGLRLAQGFAVLTLLLACANLANLTLLRASTRERELAVLAALGASRRLVARGVVVETALVTALGGAAGLWLATLAPHALRLVAAGPVPMLEHVGVDWAVVLVTLVAAGGVTLLAGVLPAAAGPRDGATLLRGGVGPDRPRRRLRSGLVVSQVALALTLAVGAALVARSFARLMSVDAGYDPAGVVSADVSLHDHQDAREFYRELHARLRDLPWVEAAGLVQSTPLTGKWTFRDPFVVVGRGGDPADAPLVSGGFVAFDYFQAMRTPLVAGRHFVEAEYLAGNARVLMINESAARRFFPGRSPLGESVVIAGRPRRIVGVVRDMRDVRLDAPAEPQWFQPAFGSGTQLIVRVAGDARALVPALRRELEASDPRFVVERIDALEDIVADTVSERSMALRLLSALALVALALAAVGLYGVLSFDVARREREFGVRSALGAPRRALLAMVLRDGARLALAGIAAGVALSLSLSGALRGLLFEVTPTDPLTIAAIAGALLLVALAASGLPAWRAARADPWRALRAE